jgi:hypothetical protein
MRFETMSTKPNTKPTPPSPERSLDAARSVVQAAERVLADLQGRRGAMLAQSSALDQERKRASFGAYTLDGDGARLLDQLRDQMAALDAEITDIGNAIEVATIRVADAKHALVKLEADQRRDQVAAELKKLQAVAGRLDELLQSFTAASREATDIVDRINAFGRPNPSRESFATLGYRAILTQLSKTLWANRTRVMAPSERTTFAELADRWSATADNKQTDEVAA